MHLYCTSCDTTINEGYHSFCKCGGMIEVAYDLDRAVLHDSENPYIRFSDLLPIKLTRDRLPKAARYTPTVHARHLGKKLGMPALYLKDETGLPTRSTKDRMAAVAIPYLWERGVRNFCTSSTGNSSTAYALAISAFPDMHLNLFTAENFISRVQHADTPQVTHFGMRDASFVDAFEYAGEYAGKHGVVSERGFFNLGRREGLKLAFMEACDQVPQPIDWYVQAVSSAMGVFGTYKGAQELRAMNHISRLPRLLCVQQDSCAPMVNAFADGYESIEPQHIVPYPAGIAEAILRGNPTRAYPYVRRIVVESDGGFVSVNETEIREAKLMVEELEGLCPCFSASTALAGVIKMARQQRFPLNQSVLINLTGADRPRSQPGPTVKWLTKSNGQWVEET